LLDGCGSTHAVRSFHRPGPLANDRPQGSPSRAGARRSQCRPDGAARAMERVPIVDFVDKSDSGAELFYLDRG
jgi:hypothetical protein